MRKFHFIVNPEAGRGKAGRSVPLIKDWLSGKSLSSSVTLTTCPGEAEALAREIASEQLTIVAVGGDGSINEVVNGIRGSGCTLGILPLGSGNDLIKNLSIPSTLSASLETLVTGTTLNIDLGEINGRLFTNSIAMGLDGAVAETMNRASVLPSALAYHYGVLKNVFFFRNKTIRWKTGDQSAEHKVNLASVMNGHTYGGSYNVAPQALINDGFLDLVVVGDYKILGRILHLPKLKSGSHLSLKKVTSLKFKKLTLECDQYIPVAIDGDLVKQNNSPIEYTIRVVPGGLKVITGLS